MCQLDHGGAASCGVLALRGHGSVDERPAGAYGRRQSVRILASVLKMHVLLGMGPAQATWCLRQRGKGGGKTMEMEGERK